MRKLGILLSKSLASSTLVITLVPGAAVSADFGSGIKAGAAAGIHGPVQLASVAYAPAQRPVGRQLGSGEPIYMGDRITTGTGGGLQVMLLDQSVLTLGENGQIVIDELVYDPGTNTGKLNFNVVKGAFRYISGQIAKDDPRNVTIDLPMGTIGIRGTIVGGVVQGDTALVALLGPGGENNTMARTGAIEVESAGGSVTITRPGYSTTLSGLGQAPTAPVQLTPSQVLQLGLVAGGGTLASPDRAAAVSPGAASAQETVAGGAAAVDVGTVQDRQGQVSSTVPAADMLNNDVAANRGAPLLSRGPGQWTLESGVNLRSATISMGGSAAVNPAPAGGSIATDGTNIMFEGDYGGSASTVFLGNRTSGGANYPAGTVQYSGVGDGGLAVTLYDLSEVTGLTESSYGMYSGTVPNNPYTANIGVFSFGTPTSVMPTGGTATFSGGTMGYVSTANNSSNFTGNVTLTANFGTQSISGSLTNLTTTNTGSSMNDISLGSTSITGSTFSGNASAVQSGTATTNIDGASGTYGGSFYGGGASEVGGTYTLTGTQTSVIGSYGAKR